ncbi:MAG: hypothetical protein V2B19_11695 [Pseudomonadota bacterium]
MNQQALIIISATPGYFWEDRQELAVAQTACRSSKNTLARPACRGKPAETMIEANQHNVMLEIEHISSYKSTRYTGNSNDSILDTFDRVCDDSGVFSPLRVQKPVKGSKHERRESHISGKSGMV